MRGWLLGLVFCVACRAFGADTAQNDGPAAPGSDAGVDVLAPLDGGVSDGSPSLACDGSVFCDSFERDAAEVKGEWSEFRQRAGDGVAITDERARAGTRSLRFDVVHEGALVTGHSVLKKEVARPQGRARAKLAVSYFAGKFSAPSNHF